MRTGFMLAICMGALFAVSAHAQTTPDTSTQPKETLSQFLARCNAGDANCLVDLKAGFDAAADDMGIICPPDNLSADDAAQAELRWMQDSAASNSAMADGDELDAEYDALNALWPCSSN